MKQYLLGIYQPDGEPPPREVLEPVMRELAALNQEMKDAGAWVFAAGLHAAEHGHGAARPRRRNRDDRRTLIEGKEHLGGFTDHRGAGSGRRARLGRRLAEAIGCRSRYGRSAIR